MNEFEKDAIDLEAVFEAARQATPELPGALADRIVADAISVQQERQTLDPGNHRGRFSQLLALIGGWPAIGGFATACAVGFWIGFAPPQIVPDPIQLVQQGEADLFAEDDLFAAMTEEG